MTRYDRYQQPLEGIAEEATEASSVAQLAFAAGVPEQIGETGVYSLTLPAGVVHETVDTVALYGDRPRRKAGTARCVDPESFAAYFARHGGEDVFLYADQKASTVTAVFNDDTAEEPGFGDHRAVLQLQVSPEWKHWEKHDGKFVAQNDFAQHIDDGLSQITSPPAMDIKELVEDFEVVQKATYRSGERLSTGERKFVFVEENQATGGNKERELTLPPHIVLRLAPWVGSDAFEIVAKFSYKVRPSEGGLWFRYQMVEPHVQLEEAFRQVTAKVGELTSATVLQGHPAGR